MKYNYKNTFCEWCLKNGIMELVLAGTGVYHHFNGGTVLCRKCNELRNHKLNSKKKKAKKVREFNKVQPSLFDNDEFSDIINDDAWYNPATFAELVEEIEGSQFQEDI